MSRPPRICSCGAIVPHGMICQCQRQATRERNARHDSHRPSARQRGYDSQWDKARADYLIAHPRCRFCGGVAQVVDHIIAHRGDRGLFWNSANWQPLCARCHNKTKQRMEREAGVVSNFRAFEGTGVGSTAQETPEITFSEKAKTS